MNPQEKQYLVEWLETVNQATSILISKLKTQNVEMPIHYKSEYKISEMARILNCSVPAIWGRIKTGNDNVKRYRGKYEVLKHWYQGKQIHFVHISQEDLKREKYGYQTFQHYGN